MKHILLIEDDENLRNSLVEILTFAKYRVEVATDGKAGIKLAMSNPPDLIISDTEMPQLDGFGVLHLVKKNEKLKDIPYIFITPNTDVEEMRRALRMGVCDFITSPISETDLLYSVERCIQKKQAEEANARHANLFLNSLSETVNLINEDREVRTFRSKEIIYAKNTRPGFLYYVKKGSVKTYQTNDAGKKYITDIYSEGDFFGYASLFLESLYTENAEVLEHCELLLVPKDEFLKAVHFNEKTTKDFISHIAKDLCKREEQLLHLAYNSVRKRVADALMMMSQKIADRNSPNPKFKISRTDLAQTIGIAKESLIRAIADFKTERLIDIDGKVIIILAPEKLKKMSN